MHGVLFHFALSHCRGNALPLLFHAQIHCLDGQVKLFPAIIVKIDSKISCFKPGIFNIDPALCSNDSVCYIGLKHMAAINWAVADFKKHYQKSVLIMKY